MKRTLALILSLVMIFCLMPMSVQAEDSTPIADVTVINDSYTVTGLVTCISGSEVYVHDGTGGICAYFTAAPTGLELGDVIKVTGKFTYYNGTPELDKVPSYEKVTGSGLTLEAEEVAYNQLTSADFGRYVSLKKLTVAEVFDNNGAYSTPNITVTDANNSSFQLYKAACGKDAAGAWNVQVGDVINVKASVGVYTKDSTTAIGERIQLRTTNAAEFEDFVELVKAPTFSNAGGAIGPNTQITLSCETEGAEIFYKIDAGEYTKYTAAITVTESCTITAYAKLGEATSETVEASYYVSDGSAMNIVEALAAGTIESGAQVYGQLVYRFGNYGGINSAIIQYKDGDQIYGLQVFNALETYTDATGTPIEIGDWVVLTGKLGPYGGVQQMQSLTAIEKAPEALEGEDASAAQVFESLQAAIDAKAELLSEYILIKNVKLGKYIDNGSTLVSDPENSNIRINIFRAADYRKWHNENDVVDMYCVMSAYNVTSQLRNGTEMDYIMTKADTVAPIITLPGAFLDAEVGVDYTINCTVEDYSGIGSVKISYTIGAQTYNMLDMTAGADNSYSFVIPGSQIVGGNDSISFTVTALDAATIPNSGAAEAEIAVVDLPQIVGYAPESNAATGDNKRPTIMVEFANIGVNPTIVMTLGETAITPVFAGNRVTYTPSADMADGRYTVSIVVTRADGKAVELSWNFYVGEATFQHYFGQLHSHTAQYSDGSGTLKQAFDYAKYNAKNVDFLAVTDHSNYFDTASNLGDMTDPTKGTMTTDGSQTKWQEAKALTATYNDDTFVALYGYEMTWSGQYGHINTFNSVGFESRNAAKYVVRNGPGLIAYYDRLVEVAAIDQEAGRSTTVNQFNHPGSTFGTFEDFAHYSAAYDELITMVEVGNGEGKVGGSMYWPSYEMYTLALDKGWHLAPTNNQDNHKGGWGDSNTCRNVIYTDNFSEEGVYEAMRNMTMYATEDDDLEITYTLNDQIMGSSIQGEVDEVNIHVDFNDPTDRISTVSIIANGGVTVARKSFGTRSGTWDVTLPVEYSYYYVRIDQADSNIAVTAPVWVGEVLKIGISSVAKDTVVDLKGEPIEFTTTLFNYETEEMVVDKIVYSIDGAVKATVNDDFTVAAEGEDSSSIWVYTPNAAGRFTLDVEVTVLFKDTKYVFTQSMAFNVRDGADMKTMLIDANHANFYVSGNYANSDVAFIELAADYGIRSSHITEPITDAVLENCDLLVLTVPFRGASISVGNALYTEDELAAIEKYAQNGGSFIVTSKSDRLEPANQNEWASVISNGILEKIGAKARIGKGIVADVVNNTNEAYRLHFMGKDYYNFESPLAEYLLENTNSMFSCYNGAPVILNGATPVVTAFDTSFVSSFADYFSGSAYMPNPETERSSYYYDACGDQEDIVVVAEEQLEGGGFCITAGVTFFSTFEVKVELENAGTLQNTNYQIVCNLFRMLNPQKVTPIKEIMEDNRINVAYTIEGWVTANASGYNQEVAFFDCIYVQDESGRGINVFPVSGNYQIGQKVRISGMTSSYMGEIELNAGNEYGGSIYDITLPYAERAELIDIEYTMADRQTVETYFVHTDRLQTKLDEVCSKNKADFVEPAAIADNFVIDDNGKVSYANQEGYFMDVVTCSRSMANAKLGNLVEIYGRVTKIELDDNGILGAIYVNDGTGTATVFLDGYINCDCADCVLDADGYHDLSAVQVGATVRIRGIASKGQNSYEHSERIGSRIRIRNRADIQVWPGEIPKTGESTTALLWVGIAMLIALAGASGAIIVRRKLNH